MICRLSEH